MSELVGAVTATARRWRVDTLPAARFLQVDDEIVEVLALYPADSIITVRRGIEGSTAASHDAGTALEAPIFGAGAGGGGGVTVDNEVDPPAEVTTLVAPGVVVGAGSALMLPAILSETEPVGEYSIGVLWVMTPEDSNRYYLFASTGDGWVEVNVGDGLGGNAGSLTGFSANGTEGDATIVWGGNPGGQIELRLKDEDGANDRNYGLVMGNARTELFYTDPDAPSPDNGISLNASGITIGVAGNFLSFHGTVPIPKPTGVAVTAEAIHAALVSLGLIDGP